MDHKGRERDKKITAGKDKDPRDNLKKREPARDRFFISPTTLTSRWTILTRINDFSVALGRHTCGKGGKVMHQFRKYELVAKDSPKKAFYNVFLIDTGSGFVVHKESGAAGKVLDTREWSRATRQEAEALIVSIVREKTNPRRKSSRHYQIVDPQLSLF